MRFSKEKITQKRKQPDNKKMKQMGN